MTKWLVLAVVIAAVLWFLGRNRRASDQKATERQAHGGTGRTADRAPTAAPEPEPMVSCAHCGLLLPRSDALAGDAPHPAGPAATPTAGPRHYCCEAHRRAGPAAP